jgi:cytochrome c oxidase subunit 3
MTFILIVSSVTMVLAVEAGHRMDKKGVIKWMIATIIGGFIFVGSQAWEWSHFIHGSEFGKVELEDGSQAIVKGHFGEIESFTVITAGDHHEVGQEITEDLLHEYKHAAADGHIINNVLTLHDGSTARINKKANEHMELVVKVAGGKYGLNHVITEEDGASAMYDKVINSGIADKVIYGANLEKNEYGPQQYGQFFFFITGFHGFHVFSGVMINNINLLQVIAGVNHKRGHYEMVEKTGLYWHFVDLVWVFVFTFFYLV